MMTQQEIKAFIADGIAQGLSLSKIQDALTGKGTHITYMELRLLASEIEVSQLEKLDKPKAKPAAPAEPAPVPGMDAGMEEGDDEELTPPEAAAPAAEEAAPEAAPAAGKTVVEVNPIAKPGFLVHGSVKFASGVTADWFLDQDYRLGLSNNSGKPTENDIMEFQKELQKVLR